MFKKIAIFAFVAIIFIYKFLKVKINIALKFKLKIFIGIVLIASFAYLIAVKYNLIQQILEIIGINTMTRIETWQELADYYDISPLFLGHGPGFTTYHFKSIGGIYFNGHWNTVGDAHNDILKAYIDFGFICFVLFISFFTVGNIRYYKKRMNKTALLFALLITYTVILVFTDNIMRYDLYLIVLYMIPVVCATNEIHMRGEGK